MGRVTVGYQDACVHPLWVSRLNLRLARLMGATAVWMPDHFMSFTPAHVWQPEFTPAAHLVPSIDALFDPIQLLALTATRIRGIDLGTSVTESIRRHPMSLAQSFVTLDHIAKGRAILGIGNGIRENTEPYGLPYERNVDRLEETLEILRLLWGSGGRPVSYSGRFWELRDAVFALPLYGGKPHRGKPHCGKPPRLFVAAHYPRMLRLAGRFGDGWLPGQKVDAPEYARRLGIIRAAATAAGRDPERFTATHTMMVALGESRESVLERAMASRFCAALALGAPAEVWRAHGRTHPLGDSHRGFLDLVPSRVTPQDVDRAAATMTPEILLTLIYAGSPRQVRDEAAPLAEAGCTHFILANAGAAFGRNAARDLLGMAQLYRLLRGL